MRDILLSVVFLCIFIPGTAKAQVCVKLVGNTSLFSTANFINEKFYRNNKTFIVQNISKDKTQIEYSIIKDSGTSKRFRKNLEPGKWIKINTQKLVFHSDFQSIKESDCKEFNSIEFKDVGQRIQEFGDAVVSLLSTILVIFLIIVAIIWVIRNNKKRESASSFYETKKVLQEKELRDEEASSDVLDSKQSVEGLASSSLAAVAETLLEEIESKADDIYFGDYSGHLNNDFLNELRYFNAVKDRIKKERIYVHLYSGSLRKISETADKILDVDVHELDMSGRQFLDLVQEMRKASMDI